ncbi:sensor histidine kinase [Pontiella agarivorans]|uniref:histidine kinase n=1 Tax=Pontiella agarivorans TaxID=3038953 RepID=A0ABU5MS88_9BACT|nr:histidine kinase [Pontiella agarivorans]MDZ8117037.1 histidine kinase [Pontiella agarivorans]
MFIALYGLVLSVFIPSAQASVRNWINTKSDRMIDQLSIIQAELNKLPKTGPVGSPTTLGYQSQLFESLDQKLTIEVPFSEEVSVDLVVLVPAIYPLDGITLSPIGFPERFYIERIFQDGTTEVIADHRNTNYELQGIEPQLFFCPDAKPIVGIRVTTTRIAEEAFLAFGEIFAFAGEYNAALNAQVVAPKPRKKNLIWNTPCLVDGHTYYRPADRTSTVDRHEFRSFSQQVDLIFDLKEERTIDELRLWPVLINFQYVQSYDLGFGFPKDIKLEVLKYPEDPAPELIFQNAEELPAPGSTPYMKRLPPVHARYLRLTVANGHLGTRPNLQKRIFLSEVEFLHRGTNLVRNISPIANTYEHDKPYKPNPDILTDGLTNDGQIVPLRVWLIDYARKKELERQKKFLEAKLDLALIQEKNRVVTVAAAAVGLAIILALMIWVVRLLDQRHWANMRDQIASDLHDEVGANLSSIAHSVEMLSELIEMPTALQKKLLNSTTQTAKMTARDTRRFIKILNPKNKRISFESQIRHIADQMLGPIKTSFAMSEIEAFNGLKPIQQWNLILFIKEVLNNTIKHANATEVRISTMRDRANVKLILQDNGCGIDPDNLPLLHLELRAKKMKGKMELESSRELGTRISLTLRVKR